VKANMHRNDESESGIEIVAMKASAAKSIGEATQQTAGAVSAWRAASYGESALAGVIKRNGESAAAAGELSAGRKPRSRQSEIEKAKHRGLRRNMKIKQA
jgi:hypothetical protein